MPPNDDKTVAAILDAITNMEHKFEDRFSEIFELYHELSLDFNKFSGKHEAQELTFLSYVDKVNHNCKAVQTQQRALDKLQVQYDLKAETCRMQVGKVSELNARMRALENTVAGITGRILGWSAAAGTLTAIAIAIAQVYFKS